MKLLTCMEREKASSETISEQHAYYLACERERLRRLKDELFAQPPLALFDDIRSREKAIQLIERSRLSLRRVRQT